LLTKEMADFEPSRSSLEKQTSPIFPTSRNQKTTIKAVIHHLPQNTPAKEISDTLVCLRFDVITVKQMTTTRRTPPEGASTVNLPLFFITLQ
jgi:hypothetical protein